MPTTSTNRKDVAQRSSSRTEPLPETVAEGSGTASGQISESSRPVSNVGNGTSPSQDRRYQPADKTPRRLLRHSGGFILDPTGSERANQARKRSARRNLHSGEGKRKDRTHDSDPIQPRSVSEGVYELEGRAKTPSFQEIDTSYSGGSSTLNGVASAQVPPGNERNHLGSESADIINLALSLNENRRRWFQTSTSNDAAALHSKQRASSGLFGQPYLAAELDNLAGSRHASGQYGSSSNNGTPNRPPISATELASRLSYGGDIGDDHEALIDRAHPDFRSAALSNSSIIPSEATMQRVQKAKAGLELAYQHRRLLQFLPELPSASSNLKRPTTSRTEPNNAGEANAMGRRYNPLQYIRNRRSRFREGCPLNPEAAGWDNVEKVQSWIARVAEQRTHHASTERTKTQLPSFPGSGVNTDIDLEDKSSSLAGDGTTSLGSKPARPRSDWETNPWSMLADAYWTAKEEHQGMIEDRHGDRLYPRAPRGKAQVPQRISLDIVPRTSQSATRRPEISTDTTSKRHASVLETAARERGRVSRRTKENTSRTEHYSSSSDRRSKWPRKILRSESASSSEEDPRRGPRASVAHRRMDSRSLQARALLERQLRELQAQETGEVRDRQSLDLEPSDHRKYSLAASPVLNAQERAPSENRRLQRSRKAETWAAEAHRDDRGDEARPEAFDSTAPSSPEHRQSVPNITINLTPPHSDKLGTFKRRALPQRSILAEVEKGLHKMHMIDPLAPSAASREESKTDSHRGSLPNVKEVDEAASPGRNPRAETQLHTKPGDTNIRVMTEPKDTDSRLRGLVRGARIAELVASPVTRVADLVWRREETGSGKNSSSSYDSLPMGMEGDAGKIGIYQEASRSDSDVSIESVATAPGYHLSNLPVFKSPFAENRPVTPVSRHENLPRLDTRDRHDDHLRDTDMGQLSPQNLRSRFATPSSVRSTEQDGSSDNKERQNSSGRRLAIVDPFVDHSIQGSTSPASAQPGSPDRGHRRWASLDAHHGFGGLELAPTTLKVTLDQVARLKVVQLSCTIRASEVARKAAKISNTTSDETAALQRKIGTARSDLPEMEQQLYTGDLMAKAIDIQLEGAKTAATKFSSDTVTGLHERLNALHGQISDDLTQMARSAEKGADELSAQLATDCTLDIKRLNETLDLILRRRRRRMRWVRRAGFAALEWIVLITLWLLWLIVVFIRLARGTIRIVVKTTKWLLWL